MVQNGYILNVSTEKLPEFLKKVREDLKENVREGVLSLVAKSAERLYDMKFVEGLKYETSIFDQAVGMVSGKISGVALGAFHDDRFDFRASLIISKPKDENSQYVLLNTENFLIQHYWDELPEVQSYKFDAAVAEDDPSYEENAEHGRIWHDIFEDAGWNIHLTGYAAQLSVQPKVEDMNISPDELKEFFSDPDIRSGEYIKNSVIIGKIKAMIGNTHIEQINPYTLLEYFLRGIAYADTQKGLAERRKLYNQIKTAFGPVMLDAITLSP